MRIVFLAPLGNIGGAERCLLNILAGLRSARPDWEFAVVSGTSGPLIARAADLGAETHILQFPERVAELGEANGSAMKTGERGSLLLRVVAASWPMWVYRRKLATLLAGLRPDVIHTNGLKMHVLASWCRPRSVAMVWHIHDYVSHKALLARVLRQHVGSCSMAIAPSRSIAADFLQVSGSNVKIRTILNAIDVSEYSPEGERINLDELSGLDEAPAGTVRIGLVATMAKWKGQEVFLRAIASLPKDLPIRAYVVGGPLYDTRGSQYALEELRAVAGQVGARDVGFTGYVSDTAAVMRSLDIVVHASTSPEPFGLVIAEAMACGRAVIFSGAGGATEIGVHGQNALSHRPGDVKELADRMLMLLTDPVLRTRLGKAGREAAVRQFDRSRLASQIIPAYQEALAHV